MRRVVIVGAGLSGLSAAYHLGRRGVTSTAFERAETPGGACRTIDRDGFHFDLSGHILHLARAESEPLLDELAVRRHLRRHRRRAAIVLAGAVTPYPIQIHTYRLPPELRRDCLLGFVEASLFGCAVMCGAGTALYSARIAPGESVAVVGAGYTGLSCALALAEGGASVAVLEAGEIGHGASGRNNGQVIPTLSRVEPAELAARAGEGFVQLVCDSAGRTFDLIRRHGMQCEAVQNGWGHPAHTPGRMRLAE